MGNILRTSSNWFQHDCVVHNGYSHQRCFELCYSPGVSVNFTDVFESSWAPDHIAVVGDQITLTLDNTPGCEFKSKIKYLFGKTSAQIKLVEGDSAGTVIAFYMSSEGANHDELDFEFLGNISGEPYLVQTNMYVNGTGGREQRHNLWLDPTADFHTYSFFWNHHSIMLEILTSTISISRYV